MFSKVDIVTTGRSGSFKRSLFSFFHTDFDEYDKCKRNLDLIYDIIAAYLKIKSKRQRFEEGEISSMFEKTTIS